VTCHRGPRSIQAYHLLKNSGFTKLHVLQGGVDAWAERIDPTMARYG
jgi:adenylyltransferase/sulfurtransferase